MNYKLLSLLFREEEDMKYETLTSDGNIFFDWNIPEDQIWILLSASVRNKTRDFVPALLSTGDINTQYGIERGRTVPYRDGAHMGGSYTFRNLPQICIKTLRIGMLNCASGDLCEARIRFIRVYKKIGVWM